jgi:uncharacterized membrane protein YbhN (UPF0104 family)
LYNRLDARCLCPGGSGLDQSSARVGFPLRGADQASVASVLVYSSAVW